MHSGEANVVTTSIDFTLPTIIFDGNNDVIVGMYCSDARWAGAEYTTALTRFKVFVAVTLK